MNPVTGDAGRGNLGAFVGRFQPLHRDHVAMILRVLNLHDHVFVGITNPDPSTRLSTNAAPHRGQDNANPLTYWQRSRLVVHALQAEKVAPDRYSVVPFPMHHPERWSSYIPAVATQHVRVFGQWEHDKAELLGQTYPVQVWENEERQAEGAVIRTAIAAGQDAATHLHPSTVGLLENFLVTAQASTSAHTSAEPAAQ